MARGIFKRDDAEFGRGLGFLDAIYGFAITLLVTNIDLPPASAWHSPATLWQQGFGVQFTGFVISFAVIAIFWRLNTKMLSRFRGIDSASLTCNLFTAALIVLLPFTTQAISDPDTREYPLATALYAVNVALAMLSQGLMLEVGRARKLLVDDVPPSARWANRIDMVAPIVVFLISIPIAYLVGPTWAQLSWLSLIVIGRITGLWSSRVAERAAAAEDKLTAE